MQIKDILTEIESFAPLPLQESYDNCGIQTGSSNMPCTGALLTLDVTEEVVDEALQLGCNLIIAHHPLIFSGLKSVTGKNYVERVLIKAIKNDITIYAAHTNMDNIDTGVNKKICNKLGLENTQVLQPLRGRLMQLNTYAPRPIAGAIRDALFAAGAGHIGAYSECSFSTEGQGSFRPSEQANPTIGQAGGDREVVLETQISVVMPDYLQARVLNALKQAHPYEEVAYECIRLENVHQNIGAGMIGNLKDPVPVQDFFDHIKNTMHLKGFKHTPPHKEYIQKVSVCGGSGSFLLSEAIRQQADVFITSDFKYHQFFDAERRIIIADIGHYESEQFTVEIFWEILNKKFPNFATHLSSTNTNPVNYYF